MTTVQRCPYRTCAAIVCHGSTIHQSPHENGGAMASAQSKSHVLALTSGKANTPWTLARPDTTCKSCTHDRVMYEPWAPHVTSSARGTQARRTTGPSGPCGVTSTLCSTCKQRPTSSKLYINEHPTTSPWQLTDGPIVCMLCHCMSGSIGQDPAAERYGLVGWPAKNKHP